MRQALLVLYTLALVCLPPTALAASVNLGSLDVAGEIKAVEGEIEQLGRELEANRKTVADRVADLRVNSPIFAERSPFESDAEFLERTSAGKKQIDRLRKQYLDDIESRLHSLRNRTFETADVCITPDPNAYQPNERLWPMKVQICGVGGSTLSFSLPIETAAAKSLSENWARVSKRGLLMLHPDRRVELVQLELVDTLAGATYRQAFPEYLVVPAGPMNPFSSSGRTHASAQLRFSQTGQQLFVRMGNQLSMIDLVTSTRVDLSSDVLAGPVVGTRENGELIVGFVAGKCLLMNNSSRFEGRHQLHVTTLKPGPDGVYHRSPADTVSLEAMQLMNGNGYPVSARRNGDCRAYFRDLGLRFNGGATAVQYGKTAWQIDSGLKLADEAVTQATWTTNYFTRSGDGRVSLNGEYRRDGTFYGKSWRVETKSEGSRLYACEPLGYTLATDGSLACVRDLKTGDVPHALSPHALSPNGDYYAVYSGGRTLIFRTLSQPTEKITSSPSLAGPPSVSTSLAFEEPSGNQMLDALETGTILVTLTNQGQGPAKGLRAVPSPVRIDHLQYVPAALEGLAPGQSAILKIPIEAYIEVPSAEHTLRFEFEEANGFPPSPVELTFSTQAYEKPRLSVLDVGIEDASGNGRLEPGEVTKLTVRIGNEGTGGASTVYARFFTGPDVFLREEYPAEVRMGDIGPGRSVDVPLEFFFNDRAPEEIPIYVDLTEATGLASAKKIRLPVVKSGRSNSIDRTVVTGVDVDGGGDAIGKDLSIDIEIDIPQTSTVNEHAIAVVIGNRDYSHGDVPPVSWALRDAATVREYLVHTLGYREGNVFLVNNATQSEFNKWFGVGDKSGKLANLVRPGESDVFVYYSGHGAPDLDSAQGYFVPVDGDPSFIGLSGYPLQTFYRKLDELEARNITVAIDSCFSGGSEGGMLIGQASPLFVRSEAEVEASPKVTRFTSSTGEQISSWYPEKKHSLFTYFFLKALGGEADNDADGQVTGAEIQSYLEEHVPYTARRLHNREQTPTFGGNAGAVLVDLNPPSQPEEAPAPAPPALE